MEIEIKFIHDKKNAIRTRSTAPTRRYLNGMKNIQNSQPMSIMKLLKISSIKVVFTSG